MKYLSVRRRFLWGYSLDFFSFSLQQFIH